MRRPFSRSSARAKSASPTERAPRGRPRLWILLLTALCAGCGGLLVETAAVRRLGLVLGNTAEASSVVLATFVGGLGLGSFLAARRSSFDPRGSAARLYAVVALGAIAGDQLTAALPALGLLPGLLVACLWPGLPAVAMGAAFPRLFAQVDGPAAAWLFAANLFGSVLTAATAPNLIVPELGFAGTQVLGACAYLAASGLLLRARPVSDAPVDQARPLSGEASGSSGLAVWTAFAAGFVLLGHEILLLRRLPFWLEGFHPTFAGVLAATLLAASLGSLLAGRLLRLGRWTSPIGWVVAASLATVLWPLQEGVTSWIAGWKIERLAWFGSRELGLHLRAILTGFVAIAPVAIATGAVVPLALARVGGEDRVRATGRVALFHGLGSLLGSLVVGTLAPGWFSTSYFDSVPLLVALMGLAIAWPFGRSLETRVFAPAVVCLTGVFLGTPWSPEPPIRGSVHFREGALEPLAHRVDRITTASVVHDRRSHSTVLYTDEFRAAETGPGTSYMRVLGHLPFLLREDLREIAVIALGTGTTADALVDWPEMERLHVVEISPAVLSLVDRFGGDGPVDTGEPARFRADPRTQIHLDDGRRWLEQREESSLDLLTMEPLLPYAPRTAALYSQEFYQLVHSRLKDDGLCVQWVPTHAVPRDAFEILLRTFGQSFEHVSVWLVDQSTLLVGSKTPHPGPSEAGARLEAGVPSRAERVLHEAGLVHAIDLEAAHIATDPELLRTGPVLRDTRPAIERVRAWTGLDKLSFFTESLGFLIDLAAEDPAKVARISGRAAASFARFDPSGERAVDAVRSARRAREGREESVLLWIEETWALRALFEATAQSTGPAELVGTARRHAIRDPGSALARWALGGAADGPFAQRTALQALAIDPLLRRDLPSFHLRPVDGASAVSPLEDLAKLPEGEALVRAASSEEPRAIAIRAAFPVRVSRALNGVLPERAWTDAEARAAAACFDPATYASAAERVFAARGAVALAEEILPRWREDLPAPPAFSALLSAGVAQRITLCQALSQRPGKQSDLLLAALLEDESEAIARESLAALRRLHQEFALPAGASLDRRRRVARVLRALHDADR